MTLQRRDVLLVVTLAAAAATPAFGQAVAPTVAPANSGKESAASVPDFSGMWIHGSIPGFEPLPSGPLRWSTARGAPPHNCSRILLSTG